jgi:CheY-like chemotaxis protein/anti-sigma regulatory factor (Ser/Thr protein kinase)
LHKKLVHALSYHHKACVAKGIRFNVRTSICDHYEYWVDPVRLMQILFNVIGNAIKFTEAGSVDVRLSTARNELVIHVEDTGIGIEPERIEHLFSPFIQADSSITRHYGGTGLGLAITKHLVELMKGTISVSSSLGQGSHFTIRLPVDSRQTNSIKIDPLEPILKQAPSSQRSQGHILVVEDTKTNQMVIQLILSRMGYNVTMVSDGQQAVSLTETSHAFDLILMDISMPVMDGIEATKILRSKNIQTPIIALTAHAMQDDHATFRQAGMNDVVLKPIRSQELQRIIKQYLNPQE